MRPIYCSSFALRMSLRPEYHHLYFFWFIWCIWYTRQSGSKAIEGTIAIFMGLCGRVDWAPFSVAPPYQNKTMNNLTGWFSDEVLLALHLIFFCEKLSDFGSNLSRIDMINMKDPALRFRLTPILTLFCSPFIISLLLLCRATTTFTIITM